MTPETLKPIIDEAAKQNDRWLFVALMVIGLFAIWMLTKYFMAQIKILSDSLDAARTRYEKHLESQTAETVQILNRSTVAIEQCARVIETLAIMDRVPNRTQPA